MGRISMPQGKGSRYHNMRLYREDGRPCPSNIDESKSSENVVLVDKTLEKAYEEIFGKAVEDYNDKQKRKDRKINSYIDHLKKSKNGEQLFYEDVLQWGSKEDFESDPKLRKILKQCLLEFVKTWPKHNPNLEIIGAYIHMDEASPHLHIDYIPVATGYKRGLSKRNSLDKAMKQMGCVPEGAEGKNNNATQVWKNRERARFAEICRDYNLEVEHEQKSERENLSVDEYKRAKDKMMADIETEKEKEVVKEAQKRLSELKVEKKEVKVNLITKKRSVTLLEGEYNDLINKHELEITELQSVNKISECENELLNNRIEKLESVPWFIESEKMRADNENLKNDIEKLKNDNQMLIFKNTKLSKKVNDLDNSLKIEKSINKDLISQISNIEELIIKLWRLIKLAIEKLVGFDNLVINRIDLESQSYCERLESERLHLKNERSIE